MLNNNFSFLSNLDSLIFLCSFLNINKLLFIFNNITNVDIKIVILISVIAAPISLYLLSNIVKIIKRNGVWVLAGGSFAAGELIVNGVWDSITNKYKPTDNSANSGGIGNNTGGSSNAGSSSGTKS